MKPQPDSHAAGGRYEDLGRIARGGMGEVRRVRDREMNRILAMKILSWELADSAPERARFLHEADITALLQHPGVVPVHDRGQLPDGRPWFTMQEVRGRTFRQVMAAMHQDDAPAPWPLRRGVELLTRACEAVAYAHDRGVVHRDLKPDNLMLGEFGEVLVMDWGLAKRIGEDHEDLQRAADHAPDRDHSREKAPPRDPALTTSDEILGTLAYMPPERARHGHRMDAPGGDVYSLGAILYELVGRRRPYTGTGEAVWGQLLSGPPAPLASLGAAVPEPLVRICERAMARDPAARYPHAGVLSAALRAWLDDTERRERARAIVARSDALVPDIAARRAQAHALRSSARALWSDILPFDPVARKAPVWAMEDRADALAREAAIAEETWLQTLRSALEEDPSLPEAHERLAQHYHERMCEAEAARDREREARYEALLRNHDRGRYTAFLSGRGALTVVTEPAGARALLYRYEERMRRLEPVFVEDLGPTPLIEAPLARGSYVLRLRAPGCAEVTYPFVIERGEGGRGDWHGVAPGERAPHVIALPRLGDIDQAGEVYVPAGWTQLGGDPEAPDALPRTRAWLDGFIISRFPITNAAYLAFLNDLVSQGRDEEAVRACPRMSSTTDGDPVLVYGRDRGRDGESGRFTLDSIPAQGPADRDPGKRWTPRSPVVRIAWRDAVAFAAWQARRGKRAYRLPHELEREKATRGVDGRFFPWGYHFDATWACMLASHPGETARVEVDAFAGDESPYGMRGGAGNTRDLCMNEWTLSGPAMTDGRFALTHADPADDAYRAVRGGAWSSVESHCRAAARFVLRPSQERSTTGIRLVRPYPA